ncbi:hypothetical protein [Paenibacillus koleovorans]|uniref:hypothetical protein n=1 Tax=Paenibacillus koleovorans TaxID=121608 RepID=UPI0013E398FA|nr:hypothetical protein [Paenibacillus koleovorans]
MQDRQTVYRIRYTLDGRPKAVYATQERVSDPRRQTLAAWYVVVLGALACVGWWLLWI